MSDLTDFLLARCAEDEDRIVHEFDCDRFMVYDYSTRQGDCDCNATTRLRADVEAKRRIVGVIHEPWFGDNVDPEYVLRPLAAVYADHPDYRDEWRS